MMSLNKTRIDQLQYHLLAREQLPQHAHPPHSDSFCERLPFVYLFIDRWAHLVEYIPSSGRIVANLFFSVCLLRWNWNPAAVG